MKSDRRGETGIRLIHTANTYTDNTHTNTQTTHTHTHTQLISNVLLPGGEKNRKAKSMTQTETGGVVESHGTINRKTDTEKQITPLTDDS